VGGSSLAMGTLMLPVPCVAEFAKRDRWRTIGLCSVGGPDRICGYVRVLVSHSRF